MKSLTKRHGDNLYPALFRAQFGSHEMSLDVPAGVWNPTPHGVHLGNVLAEVDFSGEHVLEIGTGCGVHALLLAWQGAARLTLTEIEAALLETVRHNFAKHKVDTPTEYVVADWVHIECGPFDTVVTNPPFAKSGKRYRRYFIDTLILDAHKLLKPGGRLIFVQSSMADVPRSIRMMEECGMTVGILGESDHEFRDYYFEDPTYLLEMARLPGAYDVRGGLHFERLVAFEARLPQ